MGDLVSDRKTNFLHDNRNLRNYNKKFQSTPMKLILEKHHLTIAQQSGFLEDSHAVDDLWDKLTQICDVSQALNLHTPKNEEKKYRLPQLRGNLQTLPFSSILSSKLLSIVCSNKNGLPIAKTISEQITLLDNTVKPQLVDSLDFFDIESKIASSTGLVVLLTADSLKEPQLEFAMLCAKRYFPVISQVILVHDATSCFFPGYDEQPLSVREFFSEKAITFLPCKLAYLLILMIGYAQKGVEDILEKYNQEMTALETSFNNKKSAASSLFSRIIEQSESPNAKEVSIHQFQSAMSKVCPDIDPTTLASFFARLDANQDNMINNDEFCKLIIQNEETLTKYLQYDDKPEEHENLWTRVFLSHKRSTGQGIAGRLYEGLKANYKIFLDSEAKFKIHNLKEIVFNTEVFIFILTSGIFQSRWCREELESAVENNKKIIVVRELAFQLPDPLPLEWKDSLGKVLDRQSTELIWMAEYNESCIQALKKEIGYEDKIVECEKEYSQKNPEIFNDTTITSLHLVNLDWITDEFFEKLIHNKRNIKELELTCKHLTVKSFELLSKFNNLHKIEFKYCTVTDTQINALVQQNSPLQNLILTDCWTITDNAITVLAKNCTSLKHLDISGCKHITDTGVISLAQYKVPLQNLNLSYCNITDAGIIEFAHNQIPLQTLALNGCDITDVAINTLIEYNTPLQTLNLSYCTGITDNLFTTSEYHKIQELHLIGCKNITDNLITTLIKYNIKHLNFSLTEITDAGIIKLCQHNKTLQTLKLALCKDISDVGIIALAQSHISLQYLDVSSTRVTDNAVIQLAQQKLPLQILNIRNCKITDLSLVQIVKHKMPLKLLNISETSVTNDGFLQLAQLPLLTNIYDFMCTKVTSVVKTAFPENINIDDSYYNVFVDY